jgi:RimJ/RimL family protein N-acetyltransferase
MNQEIRTERCLLRKYRENDREKFENLSIDKEVNSFIGGKCETREEAYKLFDKMFMIYEGKLLPRHFEIWAVDVDNEYAGHFELKQTGDTEDDELEVVYFLDKKFWGQGLMPEIINEINRYARSMNKQLIATISTENKNTIKALGKIGIQKQEILSDRDGKSLKIYIEPFIQNKKK